MIEKKGTVHKCEIINASARNEGCRSAQSWPLEKDATRNLESYEYDNLVLRMRSTGPVEESTSLDSFVRRHSRTRG